LKKEKGHPQLLEDEGGDGTIGVNLSQKYRNKARKRGGRPSGGKVRVFMTLLSGGSHAPVSAS
jgi:hypothetical protein